MDSGNQKPAGKQAALTRLSLMKKLFCAPASGGEESCTHFGRLAPTLSLVRGLQVERIVGHLNGKMTNKSNEVRATALRELPASRFCRRILLEQSVKIANRVVSKKHVARTVSHSIRQTPCNSESNAPLTATMRLSASRSCFFRSTQAKV